MKANSRSNDNIEPQIIGIRNLKFLLQKAYKKKIKVNNKITYAAGVCLQKKARKKNIGIKNQYIFLLVSKA